MHSWVFLYNKSIIKQAEESHEKASVLGVGHGGLSSYDPVHG